MVCCMLKYHELSSLLLGYLDGLVQLDAVREYVTLRLGDVDDDLVNQVSLEIWHFEDDLIPESELKSRLALILEESREASSLVTE